MYLQVLTIGQQAYLAVTSTNVNQPNKLKACMHYLTHLQCTHFWVQICHMFYISNFKNIAHYNMPLPKPHPWPLHYVGFEMEDEHSWTQVSSQPSNDLTEISNWTCHWTAVVPMWFTMIVIGHIVADPACTVCTSMISVVNLGSSWYGTITGINHVVTFLLRLSVDHGSLGKYGHKRRPGFNILISGTEVRTANIRIWSVRVCLAEWLQNVQNILIWLLF